MFSSAAAAVKDPSLAQASKLRSRFNGGMLSVFGTAIPTHNLR